MLVLRNNLRPSELSGLGRIICISYLAEGSRCVHGDVLQVVSCMLQSRHVRTIFRPLSSRAVDCIINFSYCLGCVSLSSDVDPRRSTTVTEEEGALSVCANGIGCSRRCSNARDPSSGSVGSVFEPLRPPVCVKITAAPDAVPVS